MTERLQRACKILQWAIDEKQRIKEACLKFNVNSKYVTDTKRECHPGQEGHKEFEQLYNQYCNKSKSVSEDLPQDKQKHSTKFSKENGIIDARGNKHVKTLDQIIKEAKIDTRIWNIDRHTINKWDVTLKEGREKIARTFQNWQVKVWLSKKVEIEEAINFEEFYKKLLAKHNPTKYKPVSYSKTKQNNNLLEINIFDLHYGKLAWSGETGEDYDIKIAAQRFITALKGLITKASGSTFDRILLPVGNDFFHSDTMNNTTTAGTALDEDTRWQKTFRTGIQLLVDGIDYLRQFAPVDIVVIPGNHDFTKSFFCGSTLEAWYRNDKCVKIDNGASPRKYYRYGKVLIGLTHGNEEKEIRLPQIMAHEARAHWAETDHHEWHCGHWHKKRAVNYRVPVYDEDLGVMIRYMSSLSATDSWHHKKSFIGTKKAAEAYLWNFDTGYIGQFNVNL